MSWLLLSRASTRTKRITQTGPLGDFSRPCFITKGAAARDTLAQTFQFLLPMMGHACERKRLDAVALEPFTQHAEERLVVLVFVKNGLPSVSTIGGMVNRPGFISTLLSGYDGPRRHFLRKRPSAAFSEMVNEVVNTVDHAASVIRRSANVMVFRGSHQAPVKVENSFCMIVCRNALRRFGMEEPFFVEITFFLPAERPTGRFSECAVPDRATFFGICSKAE